MEDPNQQRDERFKLFLSSALEWLHHEAGIPDLTRAEANKLLRHEIGRREADVRVEDHPKTVWAWLFIEWGMHRNHDCPEE